MIGESIALRGPSKKFEKVKLKPNSMENRELKWRLKLNIDKVYHDLKTMPIGSHTKPEKTEKGATGASPNPEILLTVSFVRSYQNLAHIFGVYEKIMKAYEYCSWWVCDKSSQCFSKHSNQCCPENIGFWKIWNSSL